MRTLDKVNPSLQYSGGFSDVHDPALRQPGDPEDIRSISNSANWDLRLSVPIGDAVKALFPEQKYSAGQRDQMVNQQRRLEGQQLTAAPGRVPPVRAPAAVCPTQPQAARRRPTVRPRAQPSRRRPTCRRRKMNCSTPEERQRREEEQLLGSRRGAARTRARAAAPGRRSRPGRAGS